MSSREPTPPPTEHDVVFDNNSNDCDSAHNNSILSTENFAGIAQYMQIISDHGEEFVAMKKSRKNQKLIARRIVDTILHVGGRFLTKLEAKTATTTKTTNTENNGDDDASPSSSYWAGVTIALAVENTFKLLQRQDPSFSEEQERLRGRKRNRDFDAMLALLKEFKAENGHCHVPEKHPKQQHNDSKKKGPAGATPSPPDKYFELRRWANVMRRSYLQVKRGEKSPLTLPQMVQLTEIGFVFNSRPQGVLTFEQRIEQCKAFREEHGHLSIPKRHAMGRWASRMRVEYLHYQEKNTKKEGDDKNSSNNNKNKKKQKCSLTPAKIQQLDELGFVWLVGKRMKPGALDNAKTWDERFQEFLEFKRIHGHPYVPQHMPGGLGRWVKEQRKSHIRLQRKEKGAMTSELALKLAKAGFAFDASHIRRTPKSRLERKEEDDEEDDDDDDDEKDEAKFVQEYETEPKVGNVSLLQMPPNKRMRYF